MLGTLKSLLHQAYFASTLAAASLTELHDYAAKRVCERLKRNISLREGFEQYILPLVGNDRTCARNLLTRLHCRITDEEQLRELIEQEIRQQFYQLDDDTLDTVALRAILAEFLERNIHVPIRRENVLSELAKHQLGRRDWSQSIAFWTESRLCAMPTCTNPPGVHQRELPALNR